MWTKFVTNIEPNIHGHRPRRNAYENAKRIDEGVCIDICEISPSGFVVYELFAREQSETQYRMAIMTPDGHVIDYPISREEFWNNPDMPANWAIPF